LNKIEGLHNFLADAPPKDKAWRAGGWGLTAILTAPDQIVAKRHYGKIDPNAKNIRQY
jgi:hypothetical protein